MTESNKSQPSGSFTHAFLPGLILGLVIGAVAGAFLPDWFSGSRIPAPTGEALSGERYEGPGGSRDRTDSAIDEDVFDDGGDRIDPQDPPADEPPADQP
ncbi:MAG: hypothetical protein LAT64_10870 [Phycisphaerales bacterium]|nr:hypothetical protein [Planctomycetota bacterium]MCH8509252.1 hypothetical protein [Phycisphaerales bacterium]